jgi:hypothetical protein
VDISENAIMAKEKDDARMRALKLLKQLDISQIND